MESQERRDGEAKAKKKHQRKVAAERKELKLMKPRKEKVSQLSDEFVDIDP